jgi:tetratricopeptide (TPR) repeat protein
MTPPEREITGERRGRVQALAARRDHGGVAQELEGMERTALLDDPDVGYALAVALRALGRTDEALALVGELGWVVRRRQVGRLERRVLNLESALRFERGETEAARSLWERVLELASHADDHDLVAKSSNNLGVLHTLQGRPEQAVAAYARARAAFHRLGDRRGLAQAHQNLAISYRESGFTGEADSHFRAAMEHARASDSPDILGRAEEERALLLLLVGDIEMAEAAARRAIDRLDAIGDAVGRAEALRVLGQVHLAAGRHAAAVQALEEALDQARTASASLLEAETLATLARLHDRVGEDEQARQLGAEADAVFQRLGASAWGDRLRNRLAARP